MIRFSLNSFAIRVLYIVSKRWSVLAAAPDLVVRARGPVGPWARSVGARRGSDGNVSDLPSVVR